MTTSPRKNLLADRHRKLGSNLEDWNGMGTAWTYAKDMSDEHAAVRTAAGLFDVSGLKKVQIVGPDSMAVLDHVCTRDLSESLSGQVGLRGNSQRRRADD